MYFCNIVTRTRIYQFIALYHSIKKNTKNFKIFLLCMDEDTLQILTKAQLDNVNLVSLSEIENNDLLNIKKYRKINEYCWTLKPVLLLYILNHNRYISKLTYLDADLYFFDDPERIFEASQNFSALLSEHDSNEAIKHVEIDVGRFNSGIICFKNNYKGRRCLRWWEQQCIEWCYNTTVTGQFGDQKYLEDMIILFKDVCVINVPGVNIAPWNDAKYKIHMEKGKMYINENRLISYHYCGFRIYSKTSCVFMFGDTYSPIIHNPYMEAIKNAIDLVETIDPDFDGSFIEPNDRVNFKIFSLVLI